MKILMLKTTAGSVDGIRVTTYAEGQSYDLTATKGARDLAAALVGAGLAKEDTCTASGIADAATDQAEGPSANEGAPESAAHEGAPEIKPQRAKGRK